MITRARMIARKRRQVPQKPCTETVFADKTDKATAAAIAATPEAAGLSAPSQAQPPHPPQARPAWPVWYWCEPNIGRLLRCCRAREEGQYALHHVYLDPAGVAVATEGRVMLTMPIAAEEGARELYVPQEQLRKIVQVARRHKDEQSRGIAVGVDGDELVLRAGQTEVRSPVPSGVYPAWRDVVPRPTATMTHVCLTVPLLQKLIGAMRGKRQIVLSIDRPNRPILVWTPDNERIWDMIMGAIMPAELRLGHVPPELNRQQAIERLLSHRQERILRNAQPEARKKAHER